jgi:hypothetical protein
MSKVLNSAKDVGMEHVVYESERDGEWCVISFIIKNYYARSSSLAMAFMFDDIAAAYRQMATKERELRRSNDDQG